MAQRKSTSPLFDRPHGKEKGAGTTLRRLLSFESCKLTAAEVRPRPSSSRD